MDFSDTTREKTTMYDYLNQAWFEPDTPISIFGNALPSNGGEINGLEIIIDGISLL